MINFDNVDITIIRELIESELESAFKGGYEGVDLVSAHLSAFDLPWARVHHYQSMLRKVKEHYNDPIRNEG